jgi:hypothetical protein
MEWLVILWCSLIGITDKTAIEVALGIVGAGTLFLAGYGVWIAFWLVVLAWTRANR